VSASPPPLPSRLPPIAKAAKTLAIGTIVGGRFQIVEPLAERSDAIAYRAETTDQDEPTSVALKMLTPSALPLFLKFRPNLEAAMKCHHRSLSDLLGFGTFENQPFIALAFVEGQTLMNAIQKKAAGGGKYMPRTALSLITPTASAVRAVHEHLPHGALTPRNIYVQKNGRVRVANLGYGWLLEQLLGPRGLGASSDSPFIAPEVRTDPTNATRLGDIFGLGMISICLLAGCNPSPEAAGGVATDLLSGVPETLRDLLGSAIDEDPAKRPATIDAFSEKLHDGIEDLRDQLLSSAVERESDGPGRREVTPLSTLLAVPNLPPTPDEDDPVVWLTLRDGFDYGPYSAEQVREQLLQDLIDEHTEIRNLKTGDTTFLGVSDEFGEFVEEYIPIREDRRQREAERRAAVQKQVKAAGRTGLVTLLIGILAVFGLYLFYVLEYQVEPQEIPLNSLFAEVSTDFAPPNMTFVGIAADPELIAALLNFDEEIPEAPVRRRRRRRTEETATDGTSTELPIENGDPDDLGTLDFTSGGNRRLTSNDINDTIASEFGAIRRCLRRESDVNPNYGNLGEITVQFTVRPTGRTVGADLTPGAYTDELRTCMVRIFRRMEFREFDGLALPVRFPFQIRTR
jgi:serine/threonine protein kinase